VYRIVCATIRFTFSFEIEELILLALASNVEHFCPKKVHDQSGSPIEICLTKGSYADPF
jgi:hypothetical protein